MEIEIARRRTRRAPQRIVVGRTTADDVVLVMPPDAAAELAAVLAQARLTDPGDRAEWDNTVVDLLAIRAECDLADSVHQLAGHIGRAHRLAAAATG